MDKTKFTADPHLDSEGFSSDCEAQLSTMSFGDPLFEPGQHEIRQMIVTHMGEVVVEDRNLNMSHVYLRRDLTERRHRARAANEPGIKVLGYEAFNNAGAHINNIAEDARVNAELAARGLGHVLDVARCEGCTPEACTWTDLSDEEIEAQHRHWQTMGNGWSGA